jgi:hypothetical protein
LPQRALFRAILPLAFICIGVFFGARYTPSKWCIKKLLTNSKEFFMYEKRIVTSFQAFHLP